MKTMLKGFALLLLTLTFAKAEIWEKPPYKPDENHLPRPAVVPREAQEEAPDEIKEIKKHQEVKKPNADMGLEKIDDQMNETEESNQ